jgi:hypothetical protein
MHISQEELKELFEYSSEGNLIRKKTSGNQPKGRKVGSVKYRNTKWPYKVVKVKNKPAAVHRLIFLYHHNWLPKEVDHINRDTLDNRIENLRAATRKHNSYNMTSHEGASSGYLGVSWNKERKNWRAQIQIDGNKHNLGGYKGEVEAAIAYNKAAKKHFKEYANLNIIKESV